MSQDVKLKVVLNSFPDSNGKRNWTAMFKRTDEKWDGLIGNCGGITIDHGEYWNRVAYHAERARSFSVIAIRNLTSWNTQKMSRRPKNGPVMIKKVCIAQDVWYDHRH